MAGSGECPDREVHNQMNGSQFRKGLSTRANCRVILPRPPRGPSAVSTRTRPKAVRIVDARHGRDALADTLQEALPPGSEVAVLWRDGYGGVAGSASLGASSSLAHRAESLLTREPLTVHSQRIEASWTTSEGVRVGLAAQLPAALAPEARQMWLDLARIVI